MPNLPGQLDFKFFTYWAVMGIYDLSSDHFTLVGYFCWDFLWNSVLYGDFNKPL